jgi:hypothetical protein
VAVGGKPNAEYTLESLVANLKLISTPDYWVDVRTVKLPDYEPFADAMMIEEDPALMVWVIGESTAEGRIGMADRALEVWICGVIKGRDNIQAQLIRLTASIRKCLLFNRQLNYPGVVGVPNTWGRGLEESSDAVSYQVDKGDQSKGSGVLLSKWRIFYAYPSPGG